jgi:hypothetical protein
MDRKEHGLRKGNKSKKTGRQHCKHGSNNCPQKTNLLWSPGAGCKVIVLLNLLGLNLQLWEDLLHKRTLPAEKKNCKLPKMGSHSQLPIALILQTLPVLQISCQ